MHDESATGTAGESAIEISVIVPVRDDRENLAVCLEAISREVGERRDIEILVVDDGSTDDGADVARRRGLRVFRHETSRGPGAARNTGAHHASGRVL